MGFTKLTSFLKKPGDLPDVPSPNMTPDDIRSYWETPLDELKDNQNGLIDDLTANTGAGNLGAKDVSGNTSTVQAEMNKANNGLNSHKTASILDHPDKSVVESKLADYSVSRRTIQNGAVGTQQLDPSILSQPTTQFGQQAKFDSIDAQLADIANKTKWIDPIMDYNCVGDGVTDDTTNFQNALNALNTGDSIVIPNGYRLLITQPLTIPKGYIIIRSESLYQGVLDGNTYAAGLIFKLAANSTALTSTGNRITLKNLFVQEQGPSNGCTFLSSNTDVRAENCQFYDWKTGISLLSGTYYSKFINCEWINMTTGVDAQTGVTNIHFVLPKFSCDRAINLGTGVKPVSVFGGSIEGFKTAGVYVSSHAQANIFGAYWESSSSTGNNGLIVAGGGSVNLIGNYVYLNNLTRWVNCSGSTDASINSQGNRFASSNTSSTTPQAYFLPNSGQVNISGDDWLEVAPGYGTYMGGSSYNVTGFKIAPPYNSGMAPVQYQGNEIVQIAHTSAPSTPVKNGLYLADGVTWDPLSKAYGHAYFVLWSGTAWVSVS